MVCWYVGPAFFVDACGVGMAGVTQKATHEWAEQAVIPRYANAFFFTDRLLTLLPPLQRVQQFHAAFWVSQMFNVNPVSTGSSLNLRPHF